MSISQMQKYCHNFIVKVLPKPFRDRKEKNHNEILYNHKD